MQRNIEVFNIDENKSAILPLSEPLECPLCHSKQTSKLLSAYYKLFDKDKSYIYALAYCGECQNAYISVYNGKNGSLITSEPKKFEGKKFEEYITKLSPNFVRIFNQAFEAEFRHLNDIAGMGYRKSIEFLIKDYAISNNPSEEAIISKMTLSQCINNYIYDPIVKNLALKSTWIGNDETHYLRKHNDKDINDLKRFIEATVYFLNMIHIATQAQEMN